MLGHGAAGEVGEGLLEGRVDLEERVRAGAVIGGVGGTTGVAAMRAAGKGRGGGNGASRAVVAPGLQQSVQAAEDGLVQGQLPG